MTVFVVASVVTLVVTGATIPLLHRARVMDVPNERSSHRQVIPRGGGLGVLAGLCAATAVAQPGGQVTAVLVVALLAGLLGLADDLSSLPATQRLLVQLILGFGLAAWLLRAHVEHLALLPLAVVVAAIWLVGYLNAYNFMDGINGISAASAAVAGAWYAWVGSDLEHRGLTLAGVALAGAAVGFLPWNSPKARVFLGDVGSYGLGMFIAALALLALLEGAVVVSAVAPLVIYLADTAWALVHRVRRGDPWRDAHREHVYQRLVDGGWSHLASATLVAAAATAVAVAAALLPVVWSAIVATLAAAAYLTLPAALARRGKVAPQ